MVSPPVEEAAPSLKGAAQHFEVRVVCAVSDDGLEFDEVVVGGRKVGARRAATFAAIPTTAFPVRVRLVGRHVDAVAEVPESSSSSGWVALRDATYDDGSDVKVGEAFVRVTRRPSSSPSAAPESTSESTSEWRSTARELFFQFASSESSSSSSSSSSDPDPKMTLRDFEELTKALFAVGGNVKTLAGSRRSGLLGYCVTIPDEDLFAYVLHRHVILRVCYGAVGLAEPSTWHSRLAFVGVSLLWSLSANCLVSAIFIPDASRMTQIVVITVSDSAGVSVLTVFFYVLNSPAVARACAAAYRLNVPAILTTFFAFATVMVLLVSLKPEDLYLAVYSFVPLWCTARAYDVFRLGATWALQVQLGSYPVKDDDAVKEDDDATKEDDDAHKDDDAQPRDATPSSRRGRTSHTTTPVSASSSSLSSSKRPPRRQQPSEQRLPLLLPSSGTGGKTYYGDGGSA